MSDIQFEDRSGYSPNPEGMVTENETPNTHSIAEAYPKAIIPGLKEQIVTEFTIWVLNWVESLKSSQISKLNEWAQQEEDYRARSLGPQSIPFEGASGNIVPAIAMAVDPIYARLDTGIFKTDPVFKFKPLKKSYSDIAPALEKWCQYYIRNKLDLRRVASPRMLEYTKHGTMVFKVIYDRETYPIKTYDDKWAVVKKDVTRFSGPRILGISLNDFLFPPFYQFLQDCPVVAERQLVSYEALRIAEESGKLVNCEKIKGQERFERTILETARADAANHTTSFRTESLLIEIWEIWCDYDIDGDGVPERLICTMHLPTKTILQLRYNFYFHQRKPYVVIPYTVSSDSLYGNGIAEMVKPFQDMLTKFQRAAEDNAYLVNMKMFVGRKDSGVEKSPRMYAGRTFLVDDPSKDFKQLEQTDINDSLVEERQNLFGLAEKRTGVSDYLTGRESPIVGSRATATSTLALIQEGTKRVEQVLENCRNGFSEMMLLCLYIWAQYGLDGLDDIVFGDDDTASKLKDFFDNISKENLDGAIAIDLAAADAANNQQAQQQIQLSIIQIMMQYMTQVLQLGMQAINSSSNPEFVAWATEVATAARQMFRDLLTKYQVPDPDSYLPDLEAFLAKQNTGGQNPPGGSPPPAPGTPGQPSVPTIPFSYPGPNGTGTTPAPGGATSSTGLPFPGTGQSISNNLTGLG